MGMIVATKVGYRSFYLHILLTIFDAPGGFERAAIQRAKHKPLKNGIQFVGNNHVLYCMFMLQKVWGVIDGKYVSTKSNQCCWRKADILPATWNADINN